MTATLEEPTVQQDMLVLLLSKIAKAQAGIEAIEKDGTNKAQSYSYSSIEAIVKGTRAHLIDHGLVILAAQVHVEDEGRDTRQGRSNVTTVDVVFRIYDTETGYSLELPWKGRGDDPADKGLSKALTDARKTFLLQQLNIARGDDTEADEGTDARYSVTGTVNLIDRARGLSNEQLNRALVKNGLSAQPNPFGAFAKIPEEVAEQVAMDLQEMKG